MVQIPSFTVTVSPSTAISSTGARRTRERPSGTAYLASAATPRWKAGDAVPGGSAAGTGSGTGGAGYAGLSVASWIMSG